MWRICCWDPRDHHGTRSTLTQIFGILLLRLRSWECVILWFITNQWTRRRALWWRWRKILRSFCTTLHSFCWSPTIFLCPIWPWISPQGRRSDWRQSQRREWTERESLSVNRSQDTTLVCVWRKVLPKKLAATAPGLTTLWIPCLCEIQPRISYVMTLFTARSSLQMNTNCSSWLTARFEEMSF